MKELFRKELGVEISSILIPKTGTDMKKWAVVACDQYTSEPEYWQNVNEFVGNAPSTLRLIFPEVYLEREDTEAKQRRIAAINQAMCDYLEKGIFEEINDSIIYVERTTSSGKMRKGLVLAVDLENYDFSKGSRSMIRATEGTILVRLPPRIKIRENACLELPHVMILIDDPEASTIEPLCGYKAMMRQLYSYDLMMDSGHIEGYQVNDRTLLESIFSSLTRLKSPDVFCQKYKVDDEHSPLLFAVGDGNHSLATAKSCWEKLKPTLTEGERKNHPARFALVELVNVHDSGLEFEPIHRLLFNVSASSLLSSFVKFYENKGVRCGFEYVTDIKAIPANCSSKHAIRFLHGEKNGYIWLDNPPFTLDVGSLQCFLDAFLKENPGTEIDYVHGDDVVEKIGRLENNMGFLLSPMDKGDLFKTVITDGVLPRKTFSMGEAMDKRFYLECRRIR